MPVAMLHLTTNNDTNGNPRRLFVAIGPHGRIEGVWDEGYEGREAVPAHYRTHVYDAVRIEVTPAEYRSWKKRAQGNKALAHSSAKPRGARPKSVAPGRADRKQLASDLADLKLFWRS